MKKKDQITREIKRYQQKFGKFFEPIAVFVLIFIYIVPILTVINLSPNVKTPDKAPKSVLGVESDSETSENYEILKVGGHHSVVRNEILIKPYEDRYVYQALLFEREEGEYSKPILRLVNSGDLEKEFTFTIDKTDSNTEIGLLYDNKNLILAESDNEVFPRTLTVSAGEEKTLYLSMRNKEKLNYAEDIELVITVK